MKRRLPGILICLFLFATTVLVYGRVADHEFINYDDNHYVTENDRVRAGWTLEGIRWAFTTRDQYHWHPLTWLSHMTDCRFFGLNPAPHHLVNLLFHLLNTLMVFLVFKRATGALYRSAFLAALFALHPLHVEPVAWVSARKDLLCGFFWMLGMGVYTLYVERPGLFRYALVVLCFAAALVSKPVALTLPLVFLLMDFWPLRRFHGGAAHPAAGRGDSEESLPARPQATLLRLLWEKAVFLGLAAASALITVFIMRALEPGSDRLHDLSTTWYHMGRALIAYKDYLLQALWPVGLAIPYPPKGTISGLEAVWSIGLLLVITAVARRLARRSPYFLVGWLFFLVTLFPMTGFLSSVGPQIRADRFTYIPLTGLLMIAAWGLPSLLKRSGLGRREAAAAAGVILLALGLCSWHQAGFWRDSVTLFERTIQVTTGNVQAHSHLGEALACRGRFQEAVFHLNEALRMRPDYPEANNNLGVVLARQGRLDRAVVHLERAMRTPGFADAHSNLGVVMMRQGRTDEALAQFAAALKSRPDFAPAHNNLGVALAASGRHREAIRHFQEALRLRPDFTEAKSNLDLGLGNIAP